MSIERKPTKQKTKKQKKIYNEKKKTQPLDLHTEIDIEGRSKTKLYDKRDEFSFPIMNFPFLSSSIPEAPAYGYISPN